MQNLVTLNTKIYDGTIFNGDLTDDNTTVIGAKNTKLNNFSNIKYKWARSLYKTMRENFWTPEIVNLTNDDFSKLTKHEKEAFDSILGMLVFLDSIQTVNLPNLNNYISNPEIRGCLIEQASQEELHSDSYQQIFTTLYTQKDADSVYYKFKTNKLLYERTKYISGLYQQFIDNPTLKTFIISLVANLYLEALYFYVGFAYFYWLAYNNKMVGVSSIIRLINIDEKTHIAIFIGILKEIKKVGNSEVKDFIDNTVKSIGATVFKQEYKWSCTTLKNIKEFNSSNIENYLHYLLNNNIYKPLGYTYTINYTNPFKYLEKIANIEKSDDNKGNFFETNSNTYSQVSALKGFNSF